MITYQINTDELCNLLVDNIYDDGEVHTREDGDFCSLYSESTMTYAYVWSQKSNVIGISKDRYNLLMVEAEGFTATPLIIVATPDGVYEFNMDVLNVRWELYADADRPDVMVADLLPSKGKQILEFYPEFATNEEYLDALMSDAEPSVWDEGDQW